MNWALIIGLSWLVIAVVAALLIGRALRVADQRECLQDRDGRQPAQGAGEEPTQPAASPQEAAEATSSSSEGTTPPERTAKQSPAGEPGRTSGDERLRPRRTFRRRHPGVDHLFTHRDAGAA